MRNMLFILKLSGIMIVVRISTCTFDSGKCVILKTDSVFFRNKHVIGVKYSLYYLRILKNCICMSVYFQLLF